MAGPALLEADKDRWCREKLEFFCAVVSCADREGLMTQLENCESEDEAEGLLQSLLWLQEHNDGRKDQQQQQQQQQEEEEEEEGGPTGRRDDLGRDPEPVTVVPDPDFFLPVVGHMGLQQGPHPGILLPVGQMGLFQEEDPPHPQVPEPQTFLPGGQNDPRPDQQVQHTAFFLAMMRRFCRNGPLPEILIPPELRRDGGSEREVIDPRLFFPAGLLQEQQCPQPAGVSCSLEQTGLCHEEGHYHHHAPDPHVFPSGEQIDLRQEDLQDDPYPHVFPSGAQNDLRRDRPGPAPDHIVPPVSQNDDPPQNQEVPEEDFELLPGARDEQEREVPQLRPEGDGEEVPDGFELLWLEQEDPAAEEEEEEEEEEDEEGGPSLDREGVEDLNRGETDDSERSPDDDHGDRPATTRDDPSGCEESEDDGSELERYEDAPESPLTPMRQPPAAAAGMKEAPPPPPPLRHPDGGGGGATGREIGEADVRIPPELEGAVGGVPAGLPERARPPAEETETSGDERLARQLARELEARTIEDTSGDEELARRLADESDGGSEDEDADEGAGDRLARRELLFRQQESRHAEDEVDDVVADQVAFLTNMFPDAEPDYLHERCVETGGQQMGFEQLVEELLQKKTGEPRMSGFLKKQKQAMLARGAAGTPGGDGGALVEQDAADYFLNPEQDVTANALHECSICYEEEVLEKNMATCNALYDYHKFCIDCIRKHVAVLIGQGLSRFKCMNGYCEAEFSWRTLKRVMEPVVFQKIQERKQQDEITAAGIENLESCPFCSFMIIMPNQENRVLECLNPECLQESCRLCKELSHIPFRCEEMEKDGQKDARTNIENQMAEAMIRECPRCKKRFIIEAGCNRMTCPCGAVMCYLCKTIITNDYHHFERSQVASDKCPLWSNATELHDSEVRAAAARAKEELDPSVSLVHDPTAGVI